MNPNSISKNTWIGFLIFYSVIVVSDLVCSSYELMVFLRWITKPLILIALISFFWFHRSWVKPHFFAIILLALVFSLIGDVLLLLVDRSEWFFVSGLASFLIAHLMYIFAFLKKRNTRRSFYGFLIITTLYGIFLFYLLSSDLGSLLVPVLLYMVIILFMVNAAYLRKNKVPKSSYMFVFVGALSFMLSDSILALDKFYSSISFGNLWIMSTYAFAQASIVFGVLQQEK